MSRTSIIITHVEETSTVTPRPLGVDLTVLPLPGLATILTGLFDGDPLPLP